MAEHQADVVILGGGSGGYAAALRAAELNKSVVLIEKDKVGGTCLHRGCIPTKACFMPARWRTSPGRASSSGCKASPDGIDMAGVNTYKDGVVARLYKGLQGLVKSRDITVVEGEGRLVGPHTVAVGGDPTPARTSILASGSYSRSLPGLDDRRGARTSRATTRCELDQVPGSVDRPRRRRHRL